jgi:hypothetical protein
MIIARRKQRVIIRYQNRISPICMIAAMMQKSENAVLTYHRHVCGIVRKISDIPEFPVT